MTDSKGLLCFTDFSLNSSETPHFAVVMKSNASGHTRKLEMMGKWNRPPGAVVLRSLKHLLRSGGQG